MKPQIYWPFGLILMSFALLACSNPNSDALSPKRVHQKTYILTHGADSTTDGKNCMPCHGNDLSGGKRAVSCFKCHANGAPFTLHTLPYNSANKHGPIARNNQRQCFGCHGTAPNHFDGGIVTDPDLFDIPSANCSTGLCHPDAQSHPTRWQGTNDITSGYQASHRLVSADAVENSCGLCHQVTLGGPEPRTDAPSCFSAGFTNADGSTTGCHANGPTSPHTLPYTDPADHGLDAKNNLSSCVPCHATPSDAIAGDNPRFNVPIGKMNNGCENCHAVYTAHPTPRWIGPSAISHKTANQIGTACALCHGATLNGPSEGGIGVACGDCHSAGSPLTLGGCTSCHNTPPDGQAPASNQRPNQDGSHTPHTALAGVNTNCDVCHEGAGTNTSNHYDTTSPADVTLASTYNAQSGTAVYDNSTGKCANTRCHGGQTTPDWMNGTITVNSDCESCHQTNASQYNSPKSGRHRYHVVNRNLDCTDCHSTTLLASNHFTNLATTDFEGNPWETLNASLNYNHNTQRGCSVSQCHGTETWD